MRRSPDGCKIFPLIDAYDLADEAAGQALLEVNTISVER
jgi:hypothetical protein